MMRLSLQNVLYAPIFSNRYVIPFPPVFTAHSSSQRRLALAGEFAFDYLTMPSLLAWRATSRDNYLLATKRLRSLLFILVSRFFPDPILFVKTLTQWGGLIVGEVALSVVLNDRTLTDSSLELAVGNLAFEKLVHHLTQLIPFGSHLVSCVNKPSPPSFPFLRHITRIAELHLTTGFVIHVYESSTPSACDVLCGSWTTALMNFVTASSAGCAYPRLTLSSHGVICDGRTAARRWLDEATLQRLQTHGFQFTPYSAAWPSFSTSPYSSSPPSPSGCGKSIYVCPFQARFFGDLGSLVVFFDGFFVDLGELRDLLVAPYGPMTGWRIPTQGTCPGGCIEDESVLPAYVLSMIIHFFEYGPVQLPSYKYRPIRSSYVSQSSPFRNAILSRARRLSM